MVLHHDFSRPAARTTALLLVLLAWSPPATSNPLPLTAKQALRNALEQSPELVLQRLAEAAGRTSGEVAEDTRAEAPMMGLEGGLRRNSEGNSLPEFTVGLTQSIRLSSLAAGRTAHARAFSELLGRERAEAELNIARTTLQAWLALKHWERVARNRESGALTAERLAETVEARVRVGAARPGDDALAQSMLGRARAMHLAAQSEVRASIGELQLLLDANAEFETRGEFEPPHPGAAALHPAQAVVSARALERRRMAQLSLVQERPPVGLGVTVTREGTGDWLMLARVSVPLTTSNPASYAAARVRGEVDVLEFEARHLRERLGRLRIQAEQRQRLQVQIVEHIRNREVEPARRALEVLQLQFAAAKLPLSELIVAHERFNDAELHWFEALHELELQRAQGAWIDGQLITWARTSE